MRNIYLYIRSYLLKHHFTEGNKIFCHFQSLFKVMVLNGTLYVNNVLDRETVETVTLQVFVQDMAAQQPPIQTATGEGGGGR